MKKLFAFALALTMIFSINAFAQTQGYEVNLNEHCGPIYGGPNGDECTSEFELYVYYPLTVDCVCENAICIGWFTPNQEYDLLSMQRIEDLACGFVVYGEEDYWVAVSGSWVYIDGDVELTGIVWEETINAVWNPIAQIGPYFFQQDFMLNGTGILPGYGYHYFRTYPTGVNVGAAHGWYNFSATLEAHYNF